DQRIVWMRQLIEWVQEMQEPSEFLSTLKVDLYPVEVYAFTPKGRVLALPRGATPIDFVYAIHTEVGHQCVGAKVNGQIVPLRYHLSNGDVVEILTQKGHAPAATGSTLSAPPGRAAGSGTGSTCTNALRPPKSAGSCSSAKRGSLA